jgi:hypothetical protein
LIQRRPVTLRPFFGARPRITTGIRKGRLPADATAGLHLLDGVLREGRGVDDLLQAAVQQPYERDEGVGDHFGDEFLAMFGFVAAEGKAGLFVDGRQERQELHSARGRDRTAHGVGTGDHGDDLSDS